MSLTSAANQRTFLGHPIGLYILFFTEMWERFSYYGMRALLMTYMVNYFRWTQSEASEVYKWYTSLVYVTPLIGGFLADRYLGNRIAVVIGAILMAFGHFLMAFEDYNIFYTALVLLIIGNGFFKPNMSSQVGLMYGKGDRRQDGAYTIFYMGVNLGAFLAPLACGWLAENTMGGYHSGFFIAGAGMVLGLITYLVGTPFILKLPEGTMAPPEFLSKADKTGPALTEAQAQIAQEYFPGLNFFSTSLMMVVGGGFLIWAIYVGSTSPLTKAASSGFIGLALLTVAFICTRTNNAVRDRVLAIVLLSLFVIFFWAAFEQAGNALNLWADKTTNRAWSGIASPPNLYPEKLLAPPEIGADTLIEKSSLWSLFSAKPSDISKIDAQVGEGPSGLIPTAWFQSINALGIFVLGPVFAWLWIKVDLSTPFKMVLGLLFMALSFGVMAFAGVVENQPSRVVFQEKSIPGIRFNANGAMEVLVESADRLHGKITPDETRAEWVATQAGRLVTQGNELRLKGVLSDIDRDQIVAATAPTSFRIALDQARIQLIANEKAIKESGKTGRPNAKLVLPPDVLGFDPRYSDLNVVSLGFDAATGTITIHQALADKNVKLLLVCAGDPDLRQAMDSLFVASYKFQVSPWWLVWCYFFATVGELCISPVGLSMTNKLAPAKFATMLMGLWYLTSAFGNYAAGALGKSYGLVPPVAYFGYTTAALVGAAIILLFVVPAIRRLMHGVK